jgi:predicted aspartyl protease
MGKIIVKIKVANLIHERMAQQGLIPADQVRSIETEALVDSGATLLCLRKSLIDELQLTPVKQKLAKTSNGPVMRTIYSTASVYLEDRFAHVDVSEIGEDCPNLLGQLPLQFMDWVIDPKNERLIGNPEHGGEWMLEEY